MNRLALAVIGSVAAVLWTSAASAQAVAPPAATSTPSAATSAAPPVATAAAEPDENEVICESEAPPTGSIIGARKICKTRREWKADEKQTQVGQDLHRYSQGAASGN